MAKKKEEGYVRDYNKSTFNPFGFGEKAPASPSSGLGETPEEFEYRKLSLQVAQNRERELKDRERDQYETGRLEARNKASLLDQFNKADKRDLALDKEDLALDKEAFRQTQDQAAFLEKNKQTAFNPEQFQLIYASKLEEHGGDHAKALRDTLAWTVSQGASYGDEEDDPDSLLGDTELKAKTELNDTPPHMPIRGAKLTEKDFNKDPSGWLGAVPGMLKKMVGMERVPSTPGESLFQTRAREKATSAERLANYEKSTSPDRVITGGSLLNPGTAAASESQQPQQVGRGYVEDPWAPSAPPSPPIPAAPEALTIPTRNRPAANLMDTWQNKRRNNRFTDIGSRYGSNLMRYGR